MQRNEVVRYFINASFAGDIERVAYLTGYTPAQLVDWIEDRVGPQHDTVQWIAHCALAPEFQIVTEFSPFAHNEPWKPQIAAALGDHRDAVGIYAFYDSMANLLYVGKATSNLLDEIYSAIIRDIAYEFPRGLHFKPERLVDVVAYMSAYYVGWSQMMDYPRHVESLILRISKPPLNRNIGTLAHLEVDPNT